MNSSVACLNEEGKEHTITTCILKTPSARDDNFRGGRWQHNIKLRPGRRDDWRGWALRGRKEFLVAAYNNAVRGWAFCHFQKLLKKVYLYTVHLYSNVHLYTCTLNTVHHCTLVHHCTIVHCTLVQCVFVCLATSTLQTSLSPKV